LDRIKGGEEWLDEGHGKARKEKKKELDLVIEAMKKFSHLGEPIQEQSEGQIYF
jgi:hypothetical protein